MTYAVVGLCAGITIGWLIVIIVIAIAIMFGEG